MDGKLISRGKFDEKIFFVGSNRQSLDLDFVNGIQNGNGSSFLAMKHLSSHLSATLDPFLLADIYNKKDPGHSMTSFFDVIDELCLENKILTFEDFFEVQQQGHLTVGQKNVDEHFAFDKLNMLYAQLHKVAAENPTAKKIVFDFIDDKGDILRHLYFYFTEHSNLIPKNVQLRLFHYNGNIDENGDEQEGAVRPLTQDAYTEKGSLSDHYGFMGLGDIDVNYQQTVIDMGEIAAKDGMPEAEGGYYMTELVTPEALTLWKANRASRVEAHGAGVAANLGVLGILPARRTGDSEEHAVAREAARPKLP
jgi:hypothetical protein